MAKFTAQQKIQAVQRYIEGTEGQESKAKSIGVTSGLLIIGQYQYHGESAIGAVKINQLPLLPD